MAQLAKVPNTASPAGLAAVRINGVPAAGPAMRIGVLPCTRRAKGEGAPAASRSAVRRTSITDTPIACSDLRTFSSGVQRLDAVGVQQRLVGVLVVHHEQAALAAGVEREEVHAVVVHAGLHGLVVGAVARVGREGRHAARDAGGRAPGVEHLPFVLGRHHHAVAQRGGHAGEAEARLARHGAL
jgi:hypothetical protein